MLNNKQLLPPLTAKDQDELAQLVSEYDKGAAEILRYSHDARVARKNELRAKLKTAPAAELADISTEIEDLQAAYTTARRAAKQRQRALKVKYVPLFTRLLDRADAHVDKMIEKATASYAAHLAEFKMAPVGRSPVVDVLLKWKRDLELKRHGLQFYNRDDTMMPLRPTEILPYDVEPANMELV